MSEQEREEMRQFNGATINQLCEIGCKIVDAYAADLRKQSIDWRQNDMRDYHE